MSTQHLAHCAKKDVDGVVERYGFSSLYKLVRDVFGGDIISYDNEKERGAFSSYWMGATDFYIPSHYSEKQLHDSVLREVARRIGGDDVTDEYVHEFCARMSLHLADDGSSSDDSFVTTYNNMLGEPLYQPTLLSGLRLYTQACLFTQIAGLKNWQFPTSLVRDTFDSSYMTKEEVGNLMRSENTINQILDPKLFTSKRKAAKIARKAQKQYYKNVQSELRGKVYEVKR